MDPNVSSNIPIQKVQIPKPETQNENSAPSTSAPPPMKRPVVLTVWLIIVIATSLYGIFNSVYTFFRPVVLWYFTMEIIPSWFSVGIALLSGINIIGAILLFLWKKIGFYILIGNTVIFVFFILITRGVDILRIGFAVVGLIITYFEIKPVWKNFK